MLKRLAVVLFLVLCVGIISKQTFAYNDMEDLTIVGDGKMLENFTILEYNKYYEIVGRNQFWGWHVHTVNKNMKVKYISETLFSYYNNGKSAIHYQYKTTKKIINTYDLKVTGGLKIQTDKKNKIFGDGLNASITVDSHWKSSEEVNESFDIKVDIEPKTQLTLYLYGEGKVTNGVAKNFIFWFEIARGGFEVFYVTTHYQRLEITPI